MKRRILLMILAACMLLSLPLGIAAQETLEPIRSANLDSQEYQYGRWASPIDSYLLSLADGSFMRVEYAYQMIVMEVYDKDFNLLSQRQMEPELNIFGGFGSYGGYYFLVFGQENRDEDNSREVIRVVKYDKNWNRLGSASLYGENTTVPFDAGTVRMVGYGDMLYIRTSHEMYQSDDGLNHQANVTFSVSIPDMRVTDKFTGIMNTEYGYSSHSFNQFIAIDGNKLVAADHGDAYPRSAAIFRYKTPAGGETFVSNMFRPCEYVDTLVYYGAIGANDTGAAMGAFLVTDSSYLIAGYTVEQTSMSNLRSGQRNIYVSATPKDNFTSDSVLLHYFTDYPEGSNVDISVPHMVSVGSNKYLLLWREGKDTLKWVFVDGRGEAVSQVYSGQGAISECVPTVSGNRAVWYVTNGSAPVFYSIDLSTGKLSNTDQCLYGHSYYAASQLSPTMNISGYVNLACRFCDAMVTQELPALNQVDYVCSPHIAPTCTLSGWDAYKIEVYGNSFTFYGNLSSLGHDYVNGVCSRCGEIEFHTHQYETSWRAATCTEPGYTVYTCACGDTYQEQSSAATGHDWDEGTVTTEPTTTNEGVMTYTCTACGEVKTESIPKLHGEGVRCPTYRFTAIDGSKITQDMDAGKVKLIIFYRTTCPNSIATISDLAAANWIVDPNLSILAVNMESAGSQELKDFADRYANGGQAMTFCSTTGTDMWYFLDRVGYSEDLVILPVSMLVDANGMIRWYNTGYTNESTYYDAVSKYLPDKDDPCVFGHRFDLLLMRVEPTAGEEGRLQWSCSQCGNYGMQTLPVLNETDYTVEHIRDSACNSLGLDTYTWKNTTYGDIVIRVSLPMTEHTWQSQVIKEPTRQENGKAEGSCTACTSTFSMTLAPLDSWFYTYRVTVEPTCSAEGSGVYTLNETEYGVFEFVAALPRTEHGYVTHITPPTCTTGGYDTHVCDCGESYMDGFVDALGHNWSDGVVTVQPTEDREGEKTFICLACGEKKTETMPKLDHIHKYTAAVTAPTCESQGYTTHTCVCGESFVDSYIDPLGHSWDDGVITKEPTETAEGIRTYTCTVCGETRTETVPTLEHTHAYTSSVTEPTCTDAGFTTYTCACGDSYVTDHVDALGHIFGLWIIDTESVLHGADGLKHRVCECGETEYASYSNPLTDVPNGKYFSKPVFWAYENGITKGKTATEFQLDADCTRKQIVMFLWRAAGEPEPQNMENPFVDVKADSFEKAILWAYYEGITSGKTATEFQPEAPCTREQIVMFLWRYFGKPEPQSMVNPFADVRVGGTFEKAILWAYYEGITTGKTATTFEPQATCTRGQIVTFLYRAMVEAQVKTDA